MAFRGVAEKHVDRNDKTEPDTGSPEIWQLGTLAAHLTPWRPLDAAFPMYFEGRTMKRPLLYGAAGLVLAGGLGVANVAGAADKDLNSGSGSSSGSAVAGTSAGMPPTAQVRWAVVNANGSKARSFPTSVTVVREGVGIHRVDFKNNISGCAHLGTIGLSGNVGVEQPGSIEVATANVSANQVFVTTRDNAGNFADRGFHLSVQC